MPILDTTPCSTPPGPGFSSWITEAALKKREHVDRMEEKRTGKTLLSIMPFVVWAVRRGVSVNNAYVLGTGWKITG